MSDTSWYILSIDTATPCSSVAITSGGIAAGGQVIAELSLHSSVTHSRRVLAAIAWLLAEAGLQKDNIWGYCVGLGPGSFTGLRIGVATAKGLASAAERPLYGVVSLDGIAASCSLSGLPVCVVLDARKKEVYTARYRFDDAGIARRDTAIAALSPEELVTQINERTLFIGDGLKTYGDFFRSQLGDEMVVAPRTLWSPQAATLGLLAGERATQGERPESATVLPCYVRASDAELNLKKKS